MISEVLKSSKLVYGTEVAPNSFSLSFSIVALRLGCRYEFGNYYTHRAFPVPCHVLQQHHEMGVIMLSSFLFEYVLHICSSTCTWSHTYCKPGVGVRSFETLNTHPNPNRSMQASSPEFQPVSEQDL